MTETIEQPAAEAPDTERTHRSRDRIPFAERWLSVGEIGELVGLCESQTLRTIVCRPDFPPPIRIGKPRWPAKEVQEWLHSRRCDHPTARAGGTRGRIRVGQ